MGVGKPDNIDLSIEGDILTIKVNLRRELGLSRSKKNILIATTSGKNGSRVTPFFRYRKKRGPRIKRRTKA